LKKPKFSDFKKLTIESVIRLSDNILIININEYDSFRIHVIYCIEQLDDANLQICSTSNIFSDLSSGRIYNVSVHIQRDSFQMKFFWTKQTVSKFVNTSKFIFLSKF